VYGWGLWNDAISAQGSPRSVLPAMDVTLSSRRVGYHPVPSSLSLDISSLLLILLNNVLIWLLKKVMTMFVLFVFQAHPASYNARIPGVDHAWLGETSRLVSDRNHIHCQRSGWKFGQCDISTVPRRGNLLIITLFKCKLINRMLHTALCIPDIFIWI